MDRPTSDSSVLPSAVSDMDDTCVICDRPNVLKRTMVRLEEAALKQCLECKSWTYLPRPTPAQLHAHHDSEQYFDHPYLGLRRQAVSQAEQRCRSIFSRIKAVTGTAGIKGSDMLDIGCDDGLFLSVAQRLFAVRPFGVDVASRAVVQAAKRGIEVHLGPVETAPAAFGPFDIITAIDLIEHVAFPGDLFAAIRNRLRPGGVAYVETPNTNSTIYRIGRMLAPVTGARPRYAFGRLFPSEHTQYYSLSGLTQVAAAHGLDVASAGTRPLPMSDIAVSLPLRLALRLAQWPDAMTGAGALLWAVLVRPSEPGALPASSHHL